MKIYELMEEYPGSPKIGNRITDTNPVNGSQDAWFGVNWCVPDKQSFILSKDLKPEKYPKLWKEIETPIFITYDGMKILSDDIVLYGIDKYFEMISMNAYDANKFKEDKWFSTREIAKNWIDENTPVFSKKMIKDLFIDVSEIYTYAVKDKMFKKLGL